MTNKSPLIIGLTGGIGSGKSEVSRCFSDLGIKVVDADEIAREVVLPGQSALKKIQEHFGEKALTPSGELNRTYLRNIIFNNTAEKRWLENLLHPAINQIIRTRLAQTTSPYTLLSSPLLLETQQYTLVNRILVVDTNEELQISRASKRDGSDAAQIKAIIASQIARTDRLARADDIIENISSLNDLHTQVTQLHEKYLLLAAPT